MKEKYGVEHYQQCEDFRKKSKKTMLEKYGVENIQQIKSVRRQAAQKVLERYVDRNKEFTYHPDNFFEYQFEGKIKRYFPDFTVEGKCVELKGDQFFEDKDPSKRMICPYDRKVDDSYEAKHQCMIANGVQIMTSKDYIQHEKYAEEKYGKGYIKSFQKNFQRSYFFGSK